jgi:hypothetical protein
MLMQVAAQANLGSSVGMPQVALLADAARKKMTSLVRTLFTCFMCFLHGFKVFVIFSACHSDGCNAQVVARPPVGIAMMACCRNLVKFICRL